MKALQSRYLTLLLLSVIWGGSYFFIKLLVDDFGPWTVVWIRSSLGLTAITVAMLIFRIPFQLKRIPYFPVAIMAMVNTCIPWALIGYSETHITSGMASILNATTPLCSLAVGIMFFRTITRRAQWIGMGIAIVGLAVLLGFDRVTDLSGDTIGIAGMLVASLFYGIGSQLSGRLLNTLTPFQTTFGTLLFSMAGSGIAAFAFEPISFTSFTEPSNLAASIGLGIFGSGLAYILFYRLVQSGGPEFATLVTYLLPIFSLLWGVVLLHEPFRWWMIAGLGLILAGIFAAGRKGKPAQPESSAAA